MDEFPSMALAAPASLATEVGNPVIDELMRTYRQSLSRLCHRVLRDRCLAEDVLQQVSLEALRDSREFQSRASPRTWLFSIALHRCRDALKVQRRRMQRFIPVEDDTEQIEALHEGPAAQLDRRRLSTILAQSLQELPQPSRVAVLLRFAHGMSYEEMSDQLQMKPDAARARVSRALGMMRRSLEQKGWTIDDAFGLLQSSRS